MEEEGRLTLDFGDLYDFNSDHSLELIGSGVKVSLRGGMGMIRGGKGLGEEIDLDPIRPIIIYRSLVSNRTPSRLSVYRRRCLPRRTDHPSK